MKKLVLTGIAVGALCGAPAHAADMPVKYIAPSPAPSPATSWTGCYPGIFVGGSHGRAQDFFADTAGAGFAGASINDPYSINGVLGGVTLGCNYQWANWVVGVEGDWGFTNQDGQAFHHPPSNPLFETKTTEHWFSTARGRVGYAWNNSLWFVTAGGAWASISDLTFDSTNPATLAEETHTRSGWTVGAGVEYLVGGQLSIKAEYLYVDFFTAGYNTPNPSPMITLPRDLKFNQNIVLLGLNYKFDWGKSPVVARY